MLYQWGPRTRLIKYNLVKAREFGTCPMDGHAISFGPFRLLPARRLLVEGDTPVRLGSRASDILAALVERAGEVVSKEEPLARGRPQTFVEEANLKIQVSALRCALGDGQGRPSLRRHRSRTGLQFRRPDKLAPYFGIIAR